MLPGCHQALRPLRGRHPGRGGGHLRGAPSGHPLPFNVVFHYLLSKHGRGGGGGTLGVAVVRLPLTGCTSDPRGRTGQVAAAAGLTRGGRGGGLGLGGVWGRLKGRRPPDPNIYGLK